MTKLEGIIILSADGRPIVHSHFANHFPSYPFLHSDYFNTLLTSIAAANGLVSEKGVDPNRIYFVKDLKPVLWVPGIPDGRLVMDDQDQDQEGDQDDDDGDDYHDDAGIDLSRKITRASLPTKENNVWSDQPSVTTATHANTTVHPALAPAAIDVEHKGSQVITQAQEALAEQGAALCHIQSGNLRFLCPVSREIDPLVPLSFLRTFISILQEYLAQSNDPTSLTEDVIRDNFDLVYQLFEEILDKDGNILTTEVNSLKSLVLPPNWVDKIVRAVGVSGLASATPPPMVSPIPWRRCNTKYKKNEIYLDLIESLEGIVARNGHPIVLDLWGRIKCISKLSATPDVLVCFNHPNLIQDVEFHPCLRHPNWIKDKSLSFIPPDGSFELISFRIGSPFTLPSSSSSNPMMMMMTNNNVKWNKSLPLKLSSSFSSTSSSSTNTTTISFSIQISSLSQSLESIIVTMGLPTSTQSIEAVIGTHSSHSTSSSTSIPIDSTGTSGTYLYNQITNQLIWKIPTLSSSSSGGGEKSPILKGFYISSDSNSSLPTSITTSFIISNHSISTLKLSSVQILNSSYTPFKGVRSWAEGKIVWRI